MIVFRNGAGSAPERFLALHRVRGELAKMAMPVRRKAREWEADGSEGETLTQCDRPIAASVSSPPASKAQRPSAQQLGADVNDINFRAARMQP